PFCPEAADPRAWPGNARPLSLAGHSRPPAEIQRPQQDEDRHGHRPQRPPPQPVGPCVPLPQVLELLEHLLAVVGHWRRPRFCAAGRRALVSRSFFETIPPPLVSRQVGFSELVSLCHTPGLAEARPSPITRQERQKPWGRRE